VVCQDGAPKEPGTPGIPGTAGTAGTPGTPGEAALLARTSPVPPGDACPLGGAAVVAGRDDDGDGELDEAEIETTSYVCNAATLTRMRAEAPGEHCAGGGIAFLVGRDDNGDGALDDSEVSSTEYECSDVLSRDVEVKTANDLALLVGVRVINGSLDVRQAFQESPKIEQLDLPALEYVGGALRVVGNGGLVRVSLPALDRVGDELSVEQNYSLTELSLPSLTRVGSSLSIADTFNLADLGGLAALTEVGGTLRLLDNEALTTAELPALARAGSFALVRNEALTFFGLSLGGGLETITIAMNASLERFELDIAPDEVCSACRTVRAMLVTENPALTSAHLAFERIEFLSITKNDALDALDVELERATNSFDLESSALRSLTLGRGNAGCPPLRVAGLSRLNAPIEELTVRPQALLASGEFELRNTRLPTFGLNETVSVEGNVVVEGNALLSSLAFASVGKGLLVRNNPVLIHLSAQAPGGVLRGDLAVQSCPDLASLDGFGELTEITGFLSIFACDAMSRPGWPALRRIGGNLGIDTLPALEAIAFDNLEYVGETFSLENTGMIGWSGLDQLKEVGGLRIARNDALVNIGLLSLVSASGDVEIFENDALQTLGLNALVSVLSVDVSDNPALPVCQVEALFEHVSATHEIEGGNDENGTCP
jgi:hypothetical protein